MLSRVETFDEALLKMLPVLKRFAIALCRDQTRAEDLVHDTVVKALANREKFEEGTNLGAWLTIILRNTFRGGYRKSRRMVEDPDDEIAKRVPFDDSPLKKLEVAELLRLIDKMPEAVRKPLRLIADGATYEEVAAEIHEHIGTVKSRVNRGRQILKAAD